MKLYIKQKVFSWRDKFMVKDEFGNDKYFAQGEIFTIGRKLHVYDMRGNEIAFIRAKLISFLPKYFIEINGNVYSLVKEIAFFKQKLRLEGVNWRVDGNIWAHDYSLIGENNALVMSMSKAWVSWGDYYELDIFSGESQIELLCLCVALAIDCIQADSDNNAST